MESESPSALVIATGAVREFDTTRGRNDLNALYTREFIFILRRSVAVQST